MTIATGEFGLIGSPAGRLPVEGKLPSLRQATGWLNSEPLTPAALHGKVVLVNFWTYSCVNWLRSLPFVRAWHQKYRDLGLVVLGVHTPEFTFEKNLNNVRQAVKDRNIEYPVAIDNDRAIWRDFNNNSWPALYFADAKGNLRHHRFGEGEYEESEIAIQRLLVEAGVGDAGTELVGVSPAGVEAAADWDNLRSGENYLGYERTQNFASPGGARPAKARLYTPPAKLALNQWALSGEWTIGNESTALSKPGGRIAYQYHARDLHLVMGAASPGTSVRFRVLLNGQPPAAAHGLDTDAQGNGVVSGPRMYQLLRQPKPIGDRHFEIEFLDPGVEAFSFTFG